MKANRYAKSKRRKRPPHMTLEDALHYFLDGDRPADASPWRWRGTTNSTGAPVFTWNYDIYQARRVMWEAYCGPLAEGLVVVNVNGDDFDLNPRNLATARGNATKDYAERGEHFFDGLGVGAPYLDEVSATGSPA